ncbi:MAG TPA: hypothetical protein VLA03_11040 [Draconibacterium sp.]|nr:hypothetical protein [Draconibacterium sp.]
MIVQSKNPEFDYNEREKYIYLNLGFQVENIGKPIKRDYKISVSLNFSDYIVKFNNNQPKISHSLVAENERVITFFNSSPIFAGEVLTIGTGDFGFALLRLKELAKKTELKVKLLYSNGTDERRIGLNEILKPYGVV